MELPVHQWDLAVPADDETIARREQYRMQHSVDCQTGCG
jgi:hypothetical protein